MTSSVPQFLGKLRNAEKTLKQGQRASVMHAALAAKVVFEHAPGKPGKVAGKAVGVRMRMLSNDTAQVRYTGAAHLVDRDTKAHPIGPRRRKAIRLGDGSIRSGVQHPGTRGKHFYAKAKPVAAHAAGKAFTTETRRQLRSVFGG